MKKFVFAVLSSLLLSTSCTTNIVEIDNGKLALRFDACTATLCSMVDKTTGYEYIDGTAEAAPLWKVTPLVEGEQFELPTEVKVTKLSSALARRSHAVRKARKSTAMASTVPYKGWPAW